MHVLINASRVHHGALGVDVVILAEVSDKHFPGKQSMTNS